MKIQKVTWIDSTGHSGWEKRTKDDLNLAQCVSVGRVIPSIKGTIALAQSWDDTGKTNDIMVIPRSCIRKVETL